MSEDKVSKPYYEEGVHVGQITQQGLTKAATGTTQFFLRFKVLGHPDGDENYIPHRMQYERSLFMAITEGTVAFVIESLEVLGYEHASFGPLDPSNPDHQSFKDQYVRFYCKHEPAYNRPGYTEKWQISRPVGTSTFESKPVDKKDIRQLDALFGKALKEKSAVTPKSPAKGKPQQSKNIHNVNITDDDIPDMGGAPPIDDDDIPF